MRRSILLLAFFLAPFLPAQQTTTLTTVVTDHKGDPIPNLPQSSFLVHIDGHPTPITAFQAVSSATPNTPPVNTILVVDAVNVRITSLAYERSEIARYLRSNGGRLAQPTTIAIVTDTGTQVLPTFTTDGNGLADALSKANIGLREFRGNQGFYSWIEQFQISARALQQIAATQESHPGHKLLLWISPGWPLLSGPEVQLSKREEISFFDSLVALTESLRNAHMTLSSIDPLGTADAVSYRTVFYQEFTKPVPNPRNMNIGNLALQVLATQSGGRVLAGNNNTSELIRKAASDAEAFYTITIPTPEPVSSPDNPAGFHLLAVSAELPHGETVRAPTVLYTNPPAEPQKVPNVPPPSR